MLVSERLLCLQNFIRTFTRLLKVGEVLQSGPGNLTQCCAGKEGLMTRDQDIWKGKQSSEDIVLHDGTGLVFKEQAVLLLVNIDSKVTDMPRL